MRTRIELVRAQRRLAVLWMAGSGLVFLVCVGQTLSPHPPFPRDELWQWLLPAIMPTLSLIVTTIILGRNTSAKDTVDGFTFRLTLWLSAFYLLLVVAVTFGHPFLGMIAAERVELLDRSRLFLGPVQGLVGIALGAFFSSREASSAGGDGGPTEVTT